MATFEHKRYPALTLQDDTGIWAKFTPEERVFGEHVVHVGVFTTTDSATIKKLRAATDPDLVEVKEARKAPDSDSGEGGA